LSRLAKFGMLLGFFILVAYAIVFIKKTECAWEDMKAKISVTTPSRNERVCPFSIQPYTYVFFEFSNQWPVLVADAFAQGNINFLRGVGVQNRYDLAFMMVRISREISRSVGQNLNPTFVYIASSGHRALVNYFQNNPGGFRVLKRFAWMFTSFNDDSGTLGFAEDMSLPLYSSKRSKSETHTESANEDQQPSENHVGAVPPIRLRIYRHGGQFADNYGFLCICLGWVIAGVLVFLGSGRVLDKRSAGWSLLTVGVLLDILATCSGFIGCLPWNWWRCLHDGQEHSNNQEFHGSINVTQKLLTMLDNCNTLIAVRRTQMANVFNTDTNRDHRGVGGKVPVFAPIERMTGVRRDRLLPQ